MEVSAARGVIGTVLMMLEQGATHVGVATDHVIESFRNDLYPGYKTSEGMPPELLAQFTLLEDGLRALGVTVWPMVDQEADDGLAAAARVARDDDRVGRAFICTVDKDLGQCVEDPEGRAARPAQGAVDLIDEAGVREHFGVDPGSIPDYLALVGDSADGFPGLPGWGAKSTATVLAHYEHVDAIPDDVREWKVEVRGAAKLAATLAGARDAAALFLDLATLRTDADVGAVDDWEWRGALPELAPLAARLGADNLVARCLRLRREALRMIESIEPRRSGPYRYSALASGPADGELVLLLHGFPETSYEWRAQLEVLGAAGYRAVAPDQRGYAVGARPTALEDYDVERLVDDVFGFADALGAERFHLVGHDWGGFVAWYTADRDGGATPEPRLRTLTVVSSPHPAPFEAAQHSGGDQAERSSYFEWFRSPDGESIWLADDGALLTAAYAEHPADAAAEYRRVFTADGGAALTGGLNWYRANTFHVPDGAIIAPTLYVWSTDDVALGPRGRRGHRRRGRRARTGSRCSTA